MRLASFSFGWFIGALSGAAILFAAQSFWGQLLPSGGIVTEVKPAVIKASMVEMVDLDVAGRTTTDIDDEALTKFVIPILKKDVPLTKRYARGNGVCLVGTDNQKFQPYFEDSMGRRKNEAAVNERVTLVVGEPEVLHCGITKYGFRDGPSIPFVAAPTELYNGLLDESMHQVVCAGHDSRMHSLAVESARRNLERFLETVGFKDPKVKFERKRPPEQTGVAVPPPDPSTVPLRACQQGPAPVLVAPTPTR